MSKGLINVEMPDGTIIQDVPEGITQTEVQRRYAKSKVGEDLDAIRKAQAAKYPTREKYGVDSGENPSYDAVTGRTEPPLTPSSIALEQGKENLVGALQFPEMMGRSALEVLKAGLSGNVMKLGGIAKGAVGSVAAPLNTLSRNIRAYDEAAGIRTSRLPTTPPSTEENRTMAEFSGANAAGVIAPELMAKMPAAEVLEGKAFQRLRRALPDSESLKVRANANRDVGGNIVEDASKAKNSVVGALRLGRNIYSRAAAPIQEAAAMALDRRTMPIGHSEMPLSAPPPVDANYGAPTPSTPSYDPYAPTGTRSLATPGELETGVPPKNEPQPPAAPTATPPTSSDLNKWMNVSSKDVAHGANPGERILSEKLMGADKSSTKVNVDTALKASGQALESRLKQSKEVIDANDIVIDSLSEAKGRYAPKDPTIQKNIDTIWEQIADDYPNLDKLSALEAQRLKSKLGDSIAWRGEAAAAPFNKALVRIYRALNGKIKAAVPGAAEELSRWGDLYVGSKSLAESLSRDVVGRGTGSTFVDRMKGNKGAVTADMLQGTPAIDLFKMSARDALKRIGMTTVKDKFGLASKGGSMVFVDDSGQVLRSGPSKTHIQSLLDSGLTTDEGALNEALRDHGLARVRLTPDSTAMIQLTKKPSRAQLSAIEDVLMGGEASGKPVKVYFDFLPSDKQLSRSGTARSAEEFMDALGKQSW